MSNDNASVVKIGRPPIGPRIDFRVPEDAEALVKEWAANVGRPEDEICREVFLKGIESALAVKAYRRRAATRPVGSEVARWVGR